MQIETLDRRCLTEADALALAHLLAQVFPQRGFEERLTRLRAQWHDYHGPEEEYPRSLVIRDGSRILAHAAALPRTIGTGAGDLTVVGLAQVCTDSAERGKGYGQAVTRAVFDLVDHGPFPHSLFQTSISTRVFYEKLGAGVVTNRFINSLEDDPLKNPFWDEVVMRYPAVKQWPAGEIDLRGPGW